MLTAQNITKMYHTKTVLEDVNLSANPGEVIALIGGNGTGKTTLLRILLGEVIPDEGQVLLHGETVGYVPQEPLHQEKTVQESLGSLEPWRIDYALSLVGLEKANKQAIQSLSGGQKTRLALAQVLAYDPEPSVLLLDEPTNNIDKEGMEWLRSFIAGFPGAIILVSHDRSFINTVATVVVELKNAKLKRYGGNYNFYLEQRAIERAVEEKRYEAHREEKERLRSLIRTAKHRAATGIRRKSAPDNDKMIWKFKNESVQRSLSGTAKALETRLEKLEPVERPEALKNYKILLNSSPSHDKRLMEFGQVSKPMGERLVLGSISFEVRTQQRWHITGPNGAGKSTLLRLAVGDLQPEEGKIWRSPQLSIGYFSQDVDGLDHTASGFENIQQDGMPHSVIFRQAMSMGLDQKDLQKKPSELSRGQQAKLAFTKLLFAKHDVLVLDEPTNHLDIPTKEQLEAALQAYQGALLIASHDEYFMKVVQPTHQLPLTSQALA